MEKNDQGLRTGVEASWGVRVRFKVVGELGEFDFTIFVLNLISGIVLLNSSKIVVDFAAKHCLNQKLKFQQARSRSVFMSQLDPQEANQIRGVAASSSMSAINSSS